MSEPTTLEERCVNLERELRQCGTLLRRMLDSGEDFARRGQVEEQWESIGLVLAADDDSHLLARVNTLERVAITAHRLDSEEGMPSMLRELADTIEQIRTKLDGDGFTEWNLLSGLRN